MAQNPGTDMPSGLLVVKRYRQALARKKREK